MESVTSYCIVIFCSILLLHNIILYSITLHDILFIPSQLKEAFRRELEKADFDVKKLTGILTDYKQVQYTASPQTLTTLHYP